MPQREARRPMCSPTIRGTWWWGSPCPFDAREGRDARRASDGPSSDRVRAGSAASHFTTGPSPTTPVPIGDDPETFESGGRGNQELHRREFRIGTFQANAGGQCDGQVRMLVRHVDEPGDVRAVDLVLPRLSSPAVRSELIVTDTPNVVRARLDSVELEVPETTTRWRDAMTL